MERKTKNHYGRQVAEEKIRIALDEISAARPLSLEDTAYLDEFHVRGREGTVSLVSRIGISPEDFVLDCGCGAAGALRWIRKEYGCRVLGIDASFPFLNIGRYISFRCQMEEVIPLVAADALRLPFVDATFSVILCQHVTMNIEDKKALFGEWHRVLMKEGTLALNEVVQKRGEPDFPVPWAEERGMSHLIGIEDLPGLLEAHDFRILHFKDATEEAVRWFDEASRQTRRVSLKLLMGEEIGAMSRNLRRSLEDGRLGIVEIVAQKGK